MNEFFYNFMISFAILTPTFALVTFAGLLELPWRQRTLHLLWLSVSAGAVLALLVSLLMLGS